MIKSENDGFAVTLDAPGYYSLADVLARAFEQASAGKGKERHANALPFDQQPMQTIAAAHGVGFLTGQAAKKSQEALGLPHDAKIRELLGAINYLAGAVIFLERVKPAVPVDASTAKICCGDYLACGNPNEPCVPRNMHGRIPLAKSGAQTEGIGMDPGAGDWIEWKGGPQPVPFDTLVDVRTRDPICSKVRMGAQKIRWTHAHPQAGQQLRDEDVTAYRVSYNG